MLKIILIIMISGLLCAPVSVEAYGKERKKFGPKVAEVDEKKIDKKSSWKKKRVKKRKRTVDIRRGVDGKRYRGLKEEQQQAKEVNAEKDKDENIDERREKEDGNDKKKENEENGGVEGSSEMEIEVNEKKGS